MWNKYTILKRRYFLTNSRLHSILYKLIISKTLKLITLHHSLSIGWCKTNSGVDRLLGSKTEKKPFEAKKSRRAIQSQSIQAKIENLSKTDIANAQVFGQEESA